MTFDHGAYWADKMSRKRLAVQREVHQIMALYRMGGFFDRFFANDGYVAIRAKENHGHKGHTRSLKERRMRRLAHQNRTRG
jgi:hypothetical protein